MQAIGAVSLRQDLVVPCAELSIRRQCELMGISRSGFYYEPVVETPENLGLMRRLDELHLARPVYGSRRLTALLQREGREVNRKRVVRLLQLMGVEAVYPKRSLSQPAEGHRIYPYLLEGLEISGPDQVWCSDITYVPMAYGFMYLVAVMDWWSRYVVGWELSNSLDSEFCIRAWTAALAAGRQPLISNTDQGCQFTSEAYLEAVESVGVDVSMDGRGRWIDNRFPLSSEESQRRAEWNRDMRFIQKLDQNSVAARARDAEWYHRHDSEKLVDAVTPHIQQLLDAGNKVAPQNIGHLQVGYHIDAVSAALVKLKRWDKGRHWLELFFGLDPRYQQGPASDKEKMLRRLERCKAELAKKA